MSIIRVLFLCVQNTSRSQMAEGLLRAANVPLSGAGPSPSAIQFEVESAGIEATSVREEAVVVMRDIGIDITSHYSKSLEKFINDSFDYVITVCSPATEACPYFPNAKHRLAWDFDDPAVVQGTEAMRLAAYTLTRDEIAEKIELWVRSLEP